MAKNLKLNIKNAQLAEALKLGKIQKPAAKKKEKATAPTEEASAEPIEKKAQVQETKAAEMAPPAPRAPKAKATSQPTDNEEVSRAPSPAIAPAPPSAPPPAVPQQAAEAPSPKATPPQQQPTHQPSSDRPPYQNQPYPRRDSRPHSGDRPPHSNYQRPGDRPPHSGYNRPPGDRPPHSGYNRPPGDRPPHSGYNRPPGDRPPHSGYNRPPGDRPPHSGYSRPGDRPPSPGYNRPPGDRPAPGGYNRPPHRPAGPYRPGQGQGFGPRPYPSQRPAPNPLPPQSKPGAKPHEGTEGVRKSPGFKEYRDMKPQKKTDQRSFDVRDRQGLRDNDDEAWRKKRAYKGRYIDQSQEEVIRPKNLTVRIPISIKDLAAEMKLKASQLISKLFMQGVVVTLNDILDDETTIQLLGHEFDCEIKINTSEEERLRITEKTIKEEIQETLTECVILRPPVVAFMGHVDHGKTSLIDAIRTSNIASGEAGAITQHIGAFKCHTAVGDLCILDTPGHEAFSAMRARGADVTDIVVLVIAGDEGIRTQTLEAIQQARTANVPIVVALNKSDKPGFNAENIYRQLADNNLLPESWGGTVITVNCSAVTGEGIKELLEMLALQAEILELKANPSSRARGTVIESEMHKGLGGVATVLVQTGTLRRGDAIVFAQHWARVKTMHDEHAKELSEAGPSTPVKITGLSGLPEAGSEFIVVKNEKEARELAHGRVLGQKQRLLQQTKRAGLEGLLQQTAESAEKKIFNVILKADVQGSLEALKNSLNKISSTKIDLNIISAEVGEISESDIQRAAASKATIFGFHTGIESHAEPLIKQLKVKVKLHDIIYHAIDEARLLMKGMLDKIPQESDTGEALVKTVFKSSQVGLIAGCQVTEGTIHRNNHVRVVRNKEIVWKGSISSLKRVKEDVREISKGYECGILLQNFNDVKEGDILQAYEITYLEQEL